MSTKAYYPRTEIGPGKVGFSKTRSIIEAPFYGNNVIKVNTLREAYELAKNSPGTVVTDMPVYRGEEFGLEPDPALVASAGSFGMRDAYEATMRLLDSGAEFTAIFCISDMMAIAAIKALEDRGRSVPGDCSVIGIDGLEFSEYTRPTLTTLVQPRERMGAESVRILLDMIEGRGGNRQVMLETELRPGASVRAV